MDITNPLRSLSFGVEADVLLALERTHLPLTGARVATLAGRGETQVRDVLRRLVEHGIVHDDRVGNSYTYMLNRDHVLAGAISHAARATSLVESRMRDLVGGWQTPPAAVVLFGSFARRDGDSASDIDVLLVRPDKVDDLDGWADQRHELSRRLEAWTGNPAQILELSESEMADAIARDEDIVASLRQDGLALFGALEAHVRGALV